MAFWRVAETTATSATVQVVKFTVSAKNMAISTIKPCLGYLQIKAKGAGDESQRGCRLDQCVCGQCTNNCLTSVSRESGLLNVASEAAALSRGSSRNWKEKQGERKGKETASKSIT